MHTVWTAPLDVCSVDGASRTQVVWTAPLDVHGVDGTPGCTRCGQSSWMCMAWMKPQNTHGVDSTPGCAQSGGCPKTQVV